MEKTLKDFIHRLPKTETHLHIEGALPWELLQKANPGKYLSPPTSWEPDFRFANFAHFESELLGYARDYFHSACRYHECAQSVFADRLARNVRYMEVSFASGCLDLLNLKGREVCDAIRDAVPQGLEVRIFLGIHHDGYTPKMKLILDEALTWPNLDGLDLHGAEDVPLGEWAPRYWEKARDAGKFTKAHAGEFMGADFVRYVVEALGVRRIEHGVRSIEDPDVLDLLCERGVVLDLCPISNLKLRVVPNAADYPVRRLMDYGIPVTISTDDPISFGNDIEDEYLFLANELRFTASELVQIAINGFEVALIDEVRKSEILSEVASLKK